MRLVPVRRRWRGGTAGWAAVTVLAALAAMSGCGGAAPGDDPGGAPAQEPGHEVLAALPGIPDLDGSAAYSGPGETYVGRIAGTELFLGISIVGDEAAGYLCDGQLVDVDPGAGVTAIRDAFAAVNGDAIGVWLTGTVADGSVTLSARDGTTFHGTVGEQLRGRVARAGETSHEVVLAKVGAGARDGLYRQVTEVDEVRTVEGWVVVDGEVRGVLTTDLLDDFLDATGISDIVICIKYANAIQDAIDEYDGLEPGSNMANSVAWKIGWFSGGYQRAGCPSSQMPTAPSG